MKKHHSGLVFGMLNNILYALVPVFGHFYVRTMDPLLFGTAVTFIASLPYVVKFSFQGKLGHLFNPKWSGKFFLIGLYAAAGTYLFYAGTKLTTGINTGLLINIEPVFALFLAVLILKEKVAPQQLAATLLMIAGAGVILWYGGPRLNLGDALVLLSGLLYQFSHLISKQILKKISEVSVVPAARLLCGGIIMFVVTLLLRPHSIAQLFYGHNLLAVILFAFIFRTLDLELWYQALKRMPLSMLTALTPTTAAISFIGSVLILHEVPVFRQFAGLTLIICGLLFISYIELKKEHYVWRI